MTRMSELYTKNPALGDASSLVNRLAENQKNLDGLQAELAKFQVRLIYSIHYITNQIELEVVQCNVLVKSFVSTTRL